MGGNSAYRAARRGIRCGRDLDAPCWVNGLGACLFDDSRDALLVLDPAGVVRDANREWRLLLGRVDRPGTPFTAPAGDGRLSDLEDQLKIAQSEGRARREFVTFHHAHGFDVRLDLKITPLRGHAGAAIDGWLMRARLA